jgi:hypothetical protein
MTADLLTQLNDQKRKVDFDTFDITVKELVNMIAEGFIDIAPEYQRQFRWKEERQSALIESVFLGIPIPSLFMAANPDGKWELIDGVQRLSTLVHFIGDEEVREKITAKEPLKLTGLEKLDKFNHYMFQELPQSIQFQFLLKPLKVTTISDKSDLNVRFDLFERLNRGGIILTDQEIRSCIYRGSFNELLRTLADSKQFQMAVRLPQERELDGTREEYVLRFFAFLHDYKNFDHSVKEFLNNYMKKATEKFNYKDDVELFDNVFLELSKVLPKGISRANRSTTPVNLYEGVAVGAALAYQKTGMIVTSNILEWIHSEELRGLTTDATNSNPKVRGRIEFCRDKFLGI